MFLSCFVNHYESLSLESSHCFAISYYFIYLYSLRYLDPFNRRLLKIAFVNAEDLWKLV